MKINEAIETLQNAGYILEDFEENVARNRLNELEGAFDIQGDEAELTVQRVFVGGKLTCLLNLLEVAARDVTLSGEVRCDGVEVTDLRGVHALDEGVGRVVRVGFLAGVDVGMNLLVVVYPFVFSFT